MIAIIRNCLRRRVRTTLTIAGVAIGIFALAVIGAMGEYFNTGVDDMEAYYRNRLLVAPAKDRTLTQLTARRIAQVPGVKQAVPAITGPMDRNPVIGIASTFDGIPPDMELDPPGVTLGRGRHLQPGDMYHAVIGYGVAENQGVDVGGTVLILDKPFIVVGIWERTGRSYDRFGQIPISAAQALLQRSDSVDSITVVPEEGANASALAEQIEYNVPGVEVRRPEDMVANVRQTVLMLTATFASISLLAAVIGGLFITSTMAMAVVERTREIGVKKAIGASDGDILREHLNEAILFGLAGWVVGIALSWLVTLALNAAMRNQWGLTVFMLTPRLLAITLVFAAALGALGGLYPAWRAARLSPAHALNEL